SRHRVFTVRRGGVSAGDCVRVTPALFTSTDDVDRLAMALRDVARLTGSGRSDLWSMHERFFK
ncbi:MAG TPA: hypothetical protein VM347_13735, partial [Nonomuraea sp.]|nr:hypothetical protein [Nonomuraea sp.]